MLNTIDTMIGFVVVMLIVSMAVTTLTGTLTSVFNLRGLTLRQGVTRLLALLDRGMSQPQAKAIADNLLRNPLVSRPMLFFGKMRLGDTVHREELTKLILDFAVGGDATKAADDKADHSGTTLDDLKTRLLASLKGNGIDDPNTVLTAAREAALQLEQAAPELSAAMRQNLALLNTAQSEFLGKMNAWFDQTIDRVTDLFTIRTRFVTALAALIIALFLQLDAITLLNRLQSDPATRDALVQMAIQHPEKLDPSTAGQPAAESIEKALESISKNPQINDLAARSLIDVPTSWDKWFGDLFGENASWKHWLGILLSAALLSLGAPFWYVALKNLLKLRSIVGNRDDAQRSERQTTQPSPAVDAPVIPPEFAGGERGDPEAVG